MRRGTPGLSNYGVTAPRVGKIVRTSPRHQQMAAKARPSKDLQAAMEGPSLPTPARAFLQERVARISFFRRTPELVPMGFSSCSACGPFLRITSETRPRQELRKATPGSLSGLLTAEGLSSESRGEQKLGRGNRFGGVFAGGGQGESGGLASVPLWETLLESSGSRRRSLWRGAVLR